MMDRKNDAKLDTDHVAVLTNFGLCRIRYLEVSLRHELKCMAEKRPFLFNSVSLNRSSTTLISSTWNPGCELINEGMGK